MRVIVDVTQVTRQNDNGFSVRSIEITCSRCDHSVLVFGTSERSVKRGCVMLKEECPEEEEENYYYTEE